jgi:hypothetical protein
MNPASTHIKFKRTVIFLLPFLLISIFLYYFLQNYMDTTNLFGPKNTSPITSPECKILGCNQDICLDINSPEPPISCADPSQLTPDPCMKFKSCQPDSTGRCSWHYSGQYSSCQNNPEQCGDAAEKCQGGEKCVSYADYSGQTKYTCAIPCPNGDQDCPAGMVCLSMGDGPQNVCWNKPSNIR